MSISFILITFLLQMSVGMFATVTLLPPKLVDTRFYKTIAFWSVLFTGSALALKHYATFHLPKIFGMSFVEASALASAARLFFYAFGFFSVFLWLRLHFFDRPLSRAPLLLISLIGLVALTADAWLYRPAVPPVWVQDLLIPLNFISTGLVLGGFLAGMIFGHYYLVTTEMPKKLLVSMAWILIGVLVFRIAAVGTTLLLHKAIVYPGIDFLGTLMSFEGHGIFFWERVLVGLAIPAVVVVMIWSTARIGSNQSATGIMYVAIAFVFIGELVARYLFLLSAIPL